MLDPENRWVVRARAMPWEELERVLSAKLYSSRGAPAKPLRMMLGAMMIGDHLKCSDAETVRQIQESPYMQYFVGLNEFTKGTSFRAAVALALPQEDHAVRRPGNPAYHQGSGRPGNR